MTLQTISRIAEELSQEYRGTATAKEGSATLVRLSKIMFPDGCQPAATEALVLLDTNRDKPLLLLKALPTLKNGTKPRSTGTATAAGESWTTFSFNQPWNEGLHSGLQFVEGRLRRFALSE